jgi:hypothetical protein
MTTVNSKNSIKDQAILLAMENRRAERGIEEIYWFPDDEEVRLVCVAESAGLSLSGDLEPFYFDASPEDDLPSRSAIALIRKSEFGNLNLPDGWRLWNDAVKLDTAE